MVMFRPIMNDSFLKCEIAFKSKFLSEFITEGNIKGNNGKNSYLRPIDIKTYAQEE